MTRKDITKQMLEIHERETFKRFVEESIKEVAEGISPELESELESLLLKEKYQESKIVAFNAKEAAANEPTFFAETELLAAAGQSLGEWFSQPIKFAGAGFMLDIRKVLGTNNEVDIYLIPVESSEVQLSNSLSSLIEKTINMEVMINDITLLKGAIYVDEFGEAEGSGILLDSEGERKISGKLSINISIID